MRMSDEEYFRTCVAKERHLAHLLGHHDIEEFYESAGTLWANAEALPKWTRDWHACGPLIAEYEIALSFGHDAGGAHADCIRIGSDTVRFADHPSRQRAVMYAIVKAVIAVLEHRKAAERKPHGSP
jgi:hypothetical protein